MARRRGSQAQLISDILTGKRVSVGAPPSNNAAVKLLLGISGATPGRVVNNNPFLRALTETGREPNSGSNNHIGFGTSDFGIPYKPPGADAAPPVMGHAKHPNLRGLNQAAKAAISAQYDPVIGMLGSQIGTTQAEASKAKHQIKRQGNRAVGDLAFLYGNLGRSARQTRRQADRGYHRDIRNTRESYKELHAGVNKDYSTTIGETAKELQRLGIDPSTALQGAARDQAAFNAENATSRRGAVRNERDSRREFNNMMKQTRQDIVATGIGAIGQSKSQTRTALSDLANNLADNLFKLRSQQATLKGQEASALASQRTSMIAARSKARTDSLDRKLKKAALAKALMQLNNPNGTGSGTTDPYSSTGVGKGLAYLDANQDKITHPVQLANILQYITSGSGPSKTTDFDKHNFKGADGIWAHLVKTGRRHGWTQTDMNHLQRAVEIALGMG